MQLSNHFSLEELVRSDIASRKGLDNTPTPEIIANLTELALGLEKVRELLGHPIYVSSGYRGPKVNSAVGGSKNSAHMRGYAADFTSPGFGTPQDICHAIMDSTIDYDQLIFEGTWVHFSNDPQMRRMNLTAHFGNGVTYTNGIA
jgi:hypothetical protein